MALICVLVALALVGGFVWWISGSGQRDATNACTAVVSNLLASPASAKFDVTLVTQPGDGSYIVNGTVDSQNNYGAMLRNRFRCTVKDGDASVDYLV